MSALTLESGRRDWEERFTSPLLVWYDGDARDLPWRREPTPYRVWVSEIMLQQTRVEAALPYFERFMAKLPTVADLADAPLDELYKLWEGLGYYSRVRNMHKAAQLLVGQYGGRFPLSVQEMTGLPGIGEYTAGAILSIAYSMPVPAVDGNVLRVLSRVALEGSDITLPATKRAFAALVSRIIPAARPGDFNQALMDLGAGICRPNGGPLCGACPVRGCCGALREGKTDVLPVKPPKKERRVQERTVFVVVSPRGVLLRRRAGEGLLADMWEFPSCEGALTKEQARERFPAGTPVSSLAPARHVFTHMEWRMTGYLAKCAGADAPEGYVWAPSGALETRYALPSAFKTYSALLGRLEQ